MNLLQMKYAVEVGKSGSINKASQALLTGQPNLSRAIRELEQSLGIRIFERSPQGMQPTADGEVFLKRAEEILHEVEELEEKCRAIHHTRQSFSISVPRASYISDAFIRFTNSLKPSETEIYYDETNAKTAIDNILENRYNLGIIRYAEKFSEGFARLLAEKNLDFTVLAKFRFVLIMGSDSVLAEKEEIHRRDLDALIEIAHADPYVPAVSAEEIKRDQLPPTINRRIFVYERGSQFELLSENRETFMWVSPVPEKLLQCYHLVQRPCLDAETLYQDVLIYRRGYRFSPLDQAFLRELDQAIQRHKVGQD